MTAIIGAVFSPKASRALKIDVIIVNEDAGIASAVFLGALKQGKIGQMITTILTTEERGKEMMANGKASAMLIFPMGFSDRLRRGMPSAMRFIRNPSEQFLPRIVEALSRTIVLMISESLRLFDLTVLDTIPIDTKMDYSALLPQILKKISQDPENKRKLDHLFRMMNPRILSIEKKQLEKKRQTSTINLFSYILPGISIMFLLFIIEIFIRDILTDRENGRLQRMMFAPLREQEYVMARIFSGFFMGVLTYAIVVIMGWGIFGIDWGNYFYLFLLVSVCCFWIASFFALLNAFFKNKNQAGAFVAPVVMVFSAFGGSILPIHQLPVPLQWIGRLTLNHWFISGSELIRQHRFPLMQMTILLISGLILYIAATKMLKQRILT